VVSTRPSNAQLRHVRSVILLAILSLLLVGCAGYAIPHGSPAPTPQTATISVSPSTFDFSKVPVGQSASQKLQLTNTGSEPLKVTSLAISSPAFHITGPALPQTILPGLSLEYSVAFAPTTPGPSSASLSIGSNTTVPTTTVKFAGTGEGTNNISVSPSALDFSKVPVGQSVSEKLQVTNTGSVPLQVTSLSTSNPAFIITGPSVPRTMLPGLSLDYSVEFVPTSPGVASATLSIGNSATASAATLKCVGVGEGTHANLQITPALISFGSEKLQTATTKNVTLQNTGDADMTVSGITLVGAGFGYSDLSPGFSLSPNQKVTFQIWFKPQTKGSASASVSFLSANLASPATMSLSGDGVTSTPPPPAPPPPNHSVHLAWNSSPSHIAGYKVYRGDISGGPYATISSSTTDSPAYDDSTVASGSTYYYVVTAVNRSGDESQYSNESAAIIP
jgi:Abnormal spindle-like microcephaly-assoc'd, ASPM-SPD-2-Hydin/Transmembrane protein 131-like N-terminal